MHRLVGHPIPLRRIRPSRPTANRLHCARSRTVSRNRPDGERNSRAAVPNQVTSKKAGLETAWILGLRHHLVWTSEPEGTVGTEATTPQAAGLGVPLPRCGAGPRLPEGPAPHCCQLRGRGSPDAEHLTDAAPDDRRAARIGGRAGGEELAVSTVERGFRGGDDERLDVVVVA